MTLWHEFRVQTRREPDPSTVSYQAYIAIPGAGRRSDGEYIRAPLPAFCDDRGRIGIEVEVAVEIDHVMPVLRWKAVISFKPWSKTAAYLARSLAGSMANPDPIQSSSPRRFTASIAIPIE